MNCCKRHIRNLSKIVWTRLKLNAEATNTDSSNLWSLESVLLYYKGLNIWEWTKFWNQIHFYISVSKPNLTQFLQFWISSKTCPVRCPRTIAALCLSYKCFSRTYSAFLDHSVILMQFCQKPKSIACYYFTDCPSKPNCDSYICYNFWTNTYISLLYDHGL